MLAAAVQGVSPRAAFWRGWLFGWAWLVAAVWWLFVSMHRYGGLPAPMAAMAVAALAAALALYLGLAMALLAKLRSNRADSAWHQSFGFAGAWLLAELARAGWFTGFPWGASGYAHVEGPLAAAAPWIGVYAIGAVAAWWAAATAALALALWRRRTGGLAARAGLGTCAAGSQPAPLNSTAALAAVALLSALAAPLATRDFTHGAGTLSVTLLQTNIAQDEKFAPQRLPQLLADLASDLRAAPGTLTIAPETAVPLLPQQLDDLAPRWWTQLQGEFSSGRFAIVGIPLGDETRGYTNSALLLGDGQVRQRYDKVHLVPFGEFIPPGFRWFTDALQIPLGDFARGLPDAPAMPVAGQRLAATICYEDLFGEELAGRFGAAAPEPTVLVNLSNIAWFGRTVAIDQHLHISRMRTLEFQRPMLRATNTGATAAIDHRGQVLAHLPPHTRGALTQNVEGRTGLTPFAAWASRAGLWPLWGAALVLLALAAGPAAARGVQPDSQRGPT